MTNFAVDDSDPSIDRSFGYEQADSADICTSAEVNPNKASERALLMHLEDDGHVVVKPTPRGDEKRLTALARHRKMGHVGDPGPHGCPVCKKLYTKFRRVSAKQNPTVDRDTVVGRTIYADVIYMDVPSRQGSSYAVVMIDSASGFMTGFFVALRSDIPLSR